MGRTCFLVLALVGATLARNPIVPGIGMADPHMHVFESVNESRVYLYATHDYSKGEAGGLGFRMDNWWVWSSDDLVTWQLEDVVYPNKTLTWDNMTQECWATDAAMRNGSTFFYLSVGPKQIGVVSSSRGPLDTSLARPQLQYPDPARCQLPSTPRTPPGCRRPP